jgi:hypothetical protein
MSFVTSSSGDAIAAAGSVKAACSRSMGFDDCGKIAHRLQQSLASLP